MSDPAVEAAMRTIISMAGEEWSRGQALEASAREALEPIRSEIEILREDLHFASYPEAHEVWEALNRIARHVYPSEEL